MKFSNKVYDALKFVAIIVLPASAAFYLGIGQLWDFPETEKVGTSIGIFAAFLGTLLQISTSKYKNDETDVIGDVAITGADPDTGNPDVKLTFRGLPQDLIDGKKEVKLKVGSVQPSTKPREF